VIGMDDGPASSNLIIFVKQLYTTTIANYQNGT